MKSILIILSILILSLSVNARELKVESFKLLSNDNSAVANPRIDFNGDTCALVKVNAPVSGCQFDGAIGDTDYSDGIYHLYLSPGVRKISIKCPDHENLNVDFVSLSDIPSLTGSKTYALKLLSIDNSEALDLANLVGNHSLEVKKIELLPSDISARTYERRDNNNERCALLKVALPIAGCQFNGNIGDAIYKVNEYNVYISPKTNEIIINCPGFKADTIAIPSYISGGLESGATYRLLLAGYNTSMVKLTPEFKKLLEQYDEMDDFEDGFAIVKKDDKYGVISISGEEIIPCSYTEIFGLKVWKGDKQGLYGLDGTKRLSCVYDEIKDRSTNHAWVSINGKWGLYGYGDVEVLPCRYLNVYNLEGNNLFMVESIDNKYGFVNDSIGKEVQPCKYDFTVPHRNGDGTMNIKQNGKHGLLDKNGKESIACLYDKKISLYEGIALVQRGTETALIDTQNGTELVPFGKYNISDYLGKGLFKIFQETQLSDGKYKKVYGCISRSGTQILPCKYDEIKSFDQDLAVIKQDGKYGAITPEGVEVIQPVYDYFGSIDPEMIVVKRNGKYGLVNHNGQEVVSCEYDNISSDYDIHEPAYSNGNNGYHVKLDDKNGYIDAKGNIIIPCQYDKIRRGTDMLYVEQDGKWGLYNLQGENVLPCKYDNIYYFFDENAVVQNNGKSGFINRRGEEVMPCKFDYISLFAEEGVAISEISTESGVKQALVDTKGNMLTPYKYNYIASYDDVGIPLVENGMIEVYNDGIGIVDITGRELVPCDYSRVIYSGGDLFIVCKTDKYGVVNSFGNEIIPLKYESMEEFKNGLSRVKLNGKTGFVNIKGDELWFGNNN